MENLNIETKNNISSNAVLAKEEKQRIKELEKQNLYESEFAKLNEQEKNIFLFYKEKFPNVRERTLFKRFINNLWIVHAMSEKLLDTKKCHTDWFKRAYIALSNLGEIKVKQKIDANENFFQIIGDELERMKMERQEISLSKKSYQKPVNEIVVKPVVEKQKKKVSAPIVKIKSMSKNKNKKNHQNHGQKNKFNQAQQAKKTLEIKTI